MAVQTPSNWQTVLSGAHTFETRIVVNQGTASTWTITQDNILQMPNGTETLYADSYGIGNAVMQEKSFSFKGLSNTINRGDQLAVWIRAVGADGTTTAWIPQGIYYARKPTSVTDEDFAGNDVVLTSLDAYDDMAKTEVVRYPIGVNASSIITDWNNKTMRTFAVELGSYIGISLEDATQVPTYVIPAPPFGYSIREIFQDIATAASGNWCVVYQDTSVSQSTALLQTAKFRLIGHYTPVEPEDNVLIDESNHVLAFGEYSIEVGY